MSKLFCALKLTKVMIPEEIQKDENTEIFHWMEEEKSCHFEMSDENLENF